MIMDPLKILMLYINLRGWKRQTKWPFSHAWPHRGLTFIPPGVGSVILPDSLAPASPWRWCAVPAYWRGSGGSGSRCSWCPFWREACDVSQCIYTFPTKIKGKTVLLYACDASHFLQIRENTAHNMNSLKLISWY